MTPCRTYFRADGTLLIVTGERQAEFQLTRAQAAELAAVLLRFAGPLAPVPVRASSPLGFGDDEFRSH